RDGYEVQSLAGGRVDDSVGLGDTVLIFVMEDVASHERFPQEFRNDGDFTLVPCHLFREKPHLAERSIVVPSRGAGSGASGLRSASAPARLHRFPRPATLERPGDLLRALRDRGIAVSSPYTPTEIAAGG